MVISQISQKNVDNPEKAKEILDSFLKKNTDSILLQIYEENFQDF